VNGIYSHSADVTSLADGEIIFCTSLFNGKYASKAFRTFVDRRMNPRYSVYLEIETLACNRN
jgi:hypothetical protein